MKIYIYCHKNKITGECYIGKSSNPSHRWGKDGHNYIRKNKNGNFIHPKFAEAILKYGWDEFTHDIIDEAQSSYKTSLLEKHYIEENDAIDNGYNMCLMSSNMSDGYIENRRMESLGAKNPNARGIIMLDFKTGKPLKRFKCIIDASEFLNLPRKQRHIGHCCQGIRKYAYGFAWKYDNGEDFEEVENYLDYKTEPYKNGNVPVLQFSLTGEFIREFPSIKAAKELYTTNKNIPACCRGQRKTSGGYIWKYKDISLCRNYNNKKKRGDDKDEISSS